MGTTLAAAGIVDTMDFRGESVSLTLEQAVDIMLKDNPTLKQSQLNLKQVKEDYEKVMRALRGEKDEKTPIDGFSRKDKKQETTAYLENVKLKELGNEFNMDSAERNHAALVEGLKAGLEESYFGLLQAEQSAEISKENLEVAQELHEKTKKKYELGLVSKQQVLNSELNYIKAENGYKAVLSGVKKAKMAFNIQMGYDVMKEMTLEDELVYKAYEPVGIAEAVSQALSNRKEVKALQFAYDIEKINMDIAERKYSEFMSPYKTQQISLEKALKNLEDGKKGIEMEVRANYLDLMQKQEEIKSGEKAVEVAKQALHLSEVSYDAGMSVLTDVQQAQVALQQARLGLSQAILDYNLMALKFEDSMGVGRTNSQK